MVATYIPDRGDLVWLEFSPQKGHEQAGHRPAIILSPKSYNEKSGLIICCPITGKVKGYPFEVQLPDDLQVGGVVLADQVKSFDWQGRNARFIEKAPQNVINEIINKLRTLI